MLVRFDLVFGMVKINSSGHPAGDRYRELMRERALNFVDMSGEYDHYNPW